MPPTYRLHSYRYLTVTKKTATVKPVTLRSLGVKLKEPLRAGNVITDAHLKMLTAVENSQWLTAVARQFARDGLIVQMPPGAKNDQRYWKLATESGTMFTVVDRSFTLTSRTVSATTLRALLNRSDLIEFRRPGSNSLYLCAMVNRAHGYNDPKINWGLPVGVKPTSLRIGQVLDVRRKPGRLEKAIIVNPKLGMWSRGGDANGLEVITHNGKGWTTQIIYTVDVMEVGREISSMVMDND